MLDETNVPRVGSEAPARSVPSTADGGETEPTVTSGAADVGGALVVPATGGVGAEGTTGVADDDSEADGAEVSDGDGTEVSDTEGEGEEATVSDTEGEVDGAGASDTKGTEEAHADGVVVETAVGGAVGDGSRVGLALACGARKDKQTITTAATMRDGPNVKPARVVEAT